MRNRDLLLLLALTTLWSAPFLFIEAVVTEVAPTFIALARLVFGSLTIALCTLLGLALILSGVAGVTGASYSQDVPQQPPVP